ncbi:MAG: restriction endonuclease subunit S [Treponema sp.]|uniref:restriction endonuclease subunit S n=1 Tax=Treponema sp. TaxID=166 RepID=UPI001D5132FD|nr:restriction endonuclease subunit S [Treponema sp.]MBS7309976.1 restriction endonuclease subunit S [Treponema sp.]
MSNIPKLRFPEFKGEWEEKKLNSIFTKITQRNSDNQNSNVITNSATEGLVSQRDYFDKDIANKDKTDNYFIIKNGDFVYNPRKSSAAPYGPFTQYKLLDDGIVSPLYLCLRKNNSEVESKYLENYFKTTCWHQYIYENGSSGARHDRVSIHDDVLLAMPIKVPSLPEQQKIADFLSNVDSIITAETKILKTLQKKKKALMQKLFTRQLRFKSADGTDFSAWEEKCIDEIAECIAGATPDTKKNEYWENGTIPWMSSGEVNKKYVYETDRTITQLGYKKCSTKMIPVNTVVIALAGQGKTRGTVALTKIELCTNQSLCAIINKSEYNSEYLFHYLSSQYQELRKISSGGDASRGGLNLKLVGSYRVPLPCLAEQQKIADYLSSIDSLIQTQQKVVTTWQQRKKALLQQMFI